MKTKEKNETKDFGFFKKINKISKLLPELTKINGRYKLLIRRMKEEV